MEKMHFSTFNCWYVFYICIETYDIGTHWKSLIMTFPMKIHKICFNKEIEVISFI